MLASPILVVEDEPQVRRLIRIILSKHGFRTVEEKNGLSALSTVQNLDGAIILIVSGYTLPGMDGAALARRVREQFPIIPVLLMSSDANSCYCTSGDAFLSKPFLPSILVDTIHRLLARPETECA